MAAGCAMVQSNKVATTQMQVKQRLNEELDVNRMVCPNLYYGRTAPSRWWWWFLEGIILYQQLLYQEKQINRKQYIMVATASNAVAAKRI